MKLTRSLMIATAYGVLCAASPVVLPAAEAMAEATSHITSVSIRGNQRIESRTILSYMNMQGESFSQTDIDNSLKALYATGFFADVQVSVIGTNLVVQVVENPIISRVVFEGNDRIETSDIEKELELKPRSVYSPDKVQSDTARILDIYRRSGRYNASVEPKTIQQDQNRVDLVYEISEGITANVEKISFVGNEKFSSSELREAIRTAETRWYKFLSDDDKYDPDRLQYDQELLRRFYLNEGYADFQVKTAHAELSPAKDAFYITFVVEEGPQYTLGDVQVVSELEGENTPDFKALLTTLKGDTYSAARTDESVEAITKELGDLGYAFVDIEPSLNRNTEAKTADLTYIIKPGPRVYVERINVTGNVRTLDRVVRREFRLAEGDPYNSSKLQRSEQRLNNLGFFEKVEVKNEPGSAPDKTVVNVDVQEKSTGEINIGAGYSSTDGVLGSFGISEANLLGRGQNLRTNFVLAARRKQAELGFTEPYFMGRDISAGFDIYRTYQDFTQQSSYVSDIQGVNLRTGYALQEKLQHNLYYTIHRNTISDVPTIASAYIRNQQGTNTTSAVGHDFVYDDRNSKFDPTRGYLLKFTQEVAGLGGDSKYLKHDVKSAFYQPIASKWTLGFLGGAGYVFGLSDRDVRINERFFVGGDDLRGFDNAGIGPRDTSTNDALGGNVYYTGTAELRFPLGLPEEMGVSGAVFTDAGSLWNTDDTGPNIFDQNKMRVSSGVGALWASPFGPIRMDIARALVKADADRPQTFRFSFGTRF
jgi:outer membrane protein insertion porin family